MSAVPRLAPAFHPRLRSISCIGFDWRAEVSLKETLALLHGRTLDRWQYSSEPNADVLLYESHNALATAIVRRASAAQDRTRICVPSTSEDGDALTLRYPFGASRLTHCLDHASQQLAGTVAAASADDASAHLGQRLEAALRTPGLLAIVIHSGTHQGLLYPDGRKLCWPEPMNLDQLADVLGADVALRAVTDADRETLQEVAASATIERPAEALLWAIGSLRSGSTLLDSLQMTMPYRLRRWPDFGVLGRRPADLRCASLLMQRAMSLSELASLANLPRGVAAAFLNACALCGLLETPAQAGAVKPVLTAVPGSSLLGGMLRRIRGAFALQ